MDQRQKFIQNETQRYTLMGVLFGLAFPTVATIIRVVDATLPFNAASFLFVQSTDPLLWIIDSAPFILGYIAMLAGRRQDSSHQREIELKQKENEFIEINNLLEERVAERTKELNDQTQRLFVIAEIAKDAASSKNLTDLLDRAGQLIQDRFGFYHTGLFLLDSSKDFVVLTASPTEAGKQMIANGHKLRVGYEGVVGRVASTGDARVILDTNHDTTHEYNPLLPNTRSEAAIPLRVDKDIIGVLDVQSDQPNAFTVDDVSIIQILTDQLATVIERVRLLQQVERNLRDLEIAYGRTTRESWKSVIESGAINNSGYRFDNIRIQPVNEAPLLGQRAMQEGNKVSTYNGAKQESVAIPIKLRGQTIGAVTVKLKDGYKQTTITTIEQSVERLAGSLESARLFEEARKRADREQTISHVTTAISSASDLNEILRTAVEEIGKSLGDSEVSIRITNQPEN